MDGGAAVGHGVGACIASADVQTEDGLSGDDFRIVLGGQECGGLHGGEVVDAQQNAAHRHLFARFGRAGTDHARDGRDDLGIVEILPGNGKRGFRLLDLAFGQLDLGFGNGDAGLGGFELDFGALEFVVADAAVLVETAIAVEIQGGLAGFRFGFLGGGFGDGQGGLGHRQILLGNGQGVFTVRGVDLEKGGFAGDDGIAFVHPDGVEIAIGAGGHVGVVLGFQRSLHGQAPFKGAEGRGLGSHGQSADGFSGCGRILLAATR